MPLNLDNNTISWNRNIHVRYEADIAVLGGGIAGVCAACAAAKRGLSVILVERFAVAGGDLTSGGVASFCGETAGQGELFDEIISRLEAFNAIVPYRPFEEKSSRVFDHEILAVVLQELLLTYGVKLLLHTRLIDAVVTDGTITECVISGPSGPEALRAKIFIDCTGEGVLAHAAGFETMKGRPEDGLSLPMSMMFFVRHHPDGACLPQVPEGLFGRITDKDDLPMTSIWPNGPGGNAIKIKVPCFDATDTESMTSAEIAARRRMMEVLDYFQRVEKKPWLYDGCSPQIGIREGRRITGEYVLTVDDLRAGRQFPTAIARGVYYLDGHKPDDDKRTYILPKGELKVPPYQIPLECLLAKDGNNLLMAGRCFSADQLALSSARVATTCAMTGQAAGITAVLSIKTGVGIKALEPQIVRREVENSGAKL
jgi:hypothetical protein